MSSADPVVSPENLFHQEVLALHAYSVPDSTGMIKLDAMENPYLLPPQLRGEIAGLVADAAINRYPEAYAHSLKKQIAAVTRLPQGVEILLGNGSDEIIQLLALAVAKPDAVLMSVEPSFVMYKMIAVMTGMSYVGVPLTRDFALNLPAVLAAIQSHRPALMFLAYPNNPSGNLYDAEVIGQIITAAPGLVVVDEAYYAFTDVSFIPALSRHPNLLIMRTFSKLGMAGLRLGFLAGHKMWLVQLEKLRLPYNVGVLTQIVAEKLLQNHDILLRQAEQIRQDRSFLFARLNEMTGIQPYVSEANFILFRVKHANAVFEGLKQRGVLVKNLSNSHPLLSDCLRVTVGMPQENEQFITALQESIRHGQQ